MNIYLSGRIDANNAAEKEAEISRELAKFPGEVPVFDASDLEYISSAGLRVLLKFRKQFGKNLDVLNVSGGAVLGHPIADLMTSYAHFVHLARNAEEHGTTKKIPAEVFKIEQKHLVPISQYSFAKPDASSIPYGVRKDNTVLYQGNRYRVPVGTSSLLTT